MNHHLAKTYRRRRFTVAIVILFLIFVFLVHKGLLARMSPFFSHMIIPIWRAENFAADFLTQTVTSKSDLYKQNILLRAEIAKRDQAIVEVDAVRKENESLKALMGRLRPETHTVLAAILAKPNVTPYDTLIIDRGSADGVRIDNRVFVAGDVLIGTIESVDIHTSKVLMYSTPGNISQVIYGDTGKYFNARGAGNGAMEVDISREIDVKVGDMFFYPGLDNTVVGIVRKVDFDPRDSFKKVILKSPVNIQEERWVEVRI